MNSKLIPKVTATLASILAYCSIAQAEVIVIVNPKAPYTTMTVEQVSQVFLGKNTAMNPIDQHESTPLRTEFYKKATDKDGPQVKAIWSKLIFTGKATPPREVSSNAEVKKAVASDLNAIGYIDKTSMDGSVKAVLTLP